MKFRRIGKRALILLPILVALALVALLMRTRSGPVKKEAAEIVRPLRVIKAPAVALKPRATGYGLANPGRVWRAVTELKGTVISVYPGLETGGFVDEGTIILQVNPVDYELAVARLQAGIAETRAKLAELAAEERTRNASLEIERKSLELALKSLDRLRNLLAQKAVSRDQVDREERNVLLQQQAIQQIENALALMPPRREAMEAVIAAQTVDLEQAKIDVERTEIRAPFDCRLGEVHIEKGQFLSAGQQLFEAHGTDTVEIEATFRPEQLQNLLDEHKRRRLQAGMTKEALQDLFELKVTVRLRSGDWEATWSARFDRIREVVDPRTRAINVIAVIDDPYAKAIPGIRPALVRGMYCEMELLAPPRPGTIVLPRSAVRNGRVFIVNSDNRLQSQMVTVAFAQDDLIVIDSGLDGDETVVVSDPTPAIEGMKIEPIADGGLRTRIIQQAEGEEVSQ